jgi:PadR family transcriptional regulator, regulatory protein PadR
MEKELVGASTGLLVMGILARGATYGYDILRQANAEADGLFEWREGTIYPILHKLEQQQLVRAKWKESESGRRRKYYQLTATGRRALEKRAASWRQVNALVLKVVEDGRAT